MMEAPRMDALMHSMSSEASERLMVDVDGGKVVSVWKEIGE
jgi:hypothetical protein